MDKKIAKALNRFDNLIKNGYTIGIVKNFIREELSQIAKEAEERTNKEWEECGILTDCHGCGAVVHIFPGDAARLMKAYIEPLKQSKGENE